MNWSKIIYLFISLYLGGFMLYGGYKKFAKPMPSPTKMIETFEKEGATKMKEDKSLVIKNYIFGMKQTGFFWQLLGILEINLGIMVLSQYLRFVGALMLVPITSQIFLFHIFLTQDPADLLITGFLFLACILLIAKEYSKWKSLILIKP